MNAPTEKTPLLSTLLTNSRLKCVRQCPRLHYFKYDLGYRAVADAAELAFGTLIHLALQAWWMAVQAGAPAEKWLDDALLVLKAAKPDAFALARANVMIAGYHTRWADDSAQYEVLGVEERFEFPLVNPATGGRSPTWRLGGKLDVRVRRRADGLLGIVEHKSSSEQISAGSFYWARLRLDSQISVYADGAASLTGNEVPAFCLYDVLGKPALKPLKATPAASRKYTAKGLLYAAQRAEDETPEEYQARCFEAVSTEPERYFVRAEVVRLETELVEARAEVWQQAATMRENANANRHPRNSEACGAYGRPCDFFPVCCGEASLEDTHRYVRSLDVHPELTEVPVGASVD